MTENLALAPSSNAMLANSLTNFEVQSERAARQNLEAALTAIGSSPDAYTGPEIRAMVKLEQLKLIGDLGLAEVLLRGKLIQEIEREALWSVHPNQYGSMQEAAKSQGISLSEYSDIRQLYNIVFPYIAEHMGADLALMWEEIGKSNFRELTPYLVRAITNQPNQSTNVENTFAALMDDITATNAAAGTEMTDEEVRHQVVEQLLEAGHLTNRQMRERVRPERTPSIPAMTVDYSEGDRRRLVIAHITEDQYTMMQRRLNGYIEFMPVSMGDLSRTNFASELLNIREE
jgi:hypothetical protein